MKIKDICTSLTDGSHNPPQGVEHSDFFMLSSKNIYDDEITFEDPRYLDEATYRAEDKRTKVQPEDVLLTIVGTVGRSAVVSKDMPKFTLQRSVAVLHPNKDICLPRFLMYALQGERSYIESRAKGVAQKGIYLGEVSAIDLVVPPISEQGNVVDKLDAAKHIIKKRQQQLSALDNLIKARFVEMFGDLRANPKGWRIQTFDELTELITDGEHATPRRVDDGIYLLSARNVLNHSLQLDDVDYIDQEEYDRIAKRIVPQEGDVLISCSGTVGRCCSVPANMRFQMVRSAALLRFKAKINPVFAEYMITSDYLQEQIASAKTASSQANLFQGKIAKLKGFVPPLELQDDFLSTVKQVDKSKYATADELTRFNNCFGHLQEQMI